MTRQPVAAIEQNEIRISLSRPFNPGYACSGCSVKGLLRMPIYEIQTSGISPLCETTFRSAGIKEQDLQRCFREKIEVIAPRTLVISEEFGDWDKSLRRIDLLAIDKEANLVVVELKRTEDGGHMELQALRYAAMISKMTFDQAVRCFENHLKKMERTGQESEARKKILEFLERDEIDDERFPQDVRIILVSAEFSPELTTTVLWLRDKEVDIRCIRLKPYKLDDRRLLADVQEIIPLPEEANYQVQIRERRQQVRQARDGKMAQIRKLAVDKLNAQADGIHYGALVKQIMDETGFTRGSVQSAIWDLDKQVSTVERPETGLFRYKPLQENAPGVSDQIAG